MKKIIGFLLLAMTLLVFCGSEDIIGPDNPENDKFKNEKALPN